MPSFNVTATTTALSIPVEVYDYTVTVQDQYSGLLANVPVTLTGMTNFMVDTNDKGVAEFVDVPKGTYTIGVDGYYVSDGEVSISYTTTKTVKVSDGVPMAIHVPAPEVTVFVYGDAFSTSKFFETDMETIVLPKSDISNTIYTVYCFYDGKLYCAAADTSLTSVTLDPKDLAVVTGTLKNSEDTAVSGTVYFMSGDMKFKYSADAEKGYKAYVPAGEELTVYATDSTDAYFGKQTYTAGANADKNIAMADAHKVSSSSLYWNSVYYTYAMVTATVGGTYTLPLMTSSGSFTFYLPQGTAATVAFAPTSTYTAVNKDVAADITSDQTLSMSLTLTADITMTVNNNLGASVDDIDLSISGTKHKVSEWASETFKVTSNSMYVTLGESSGSVYFSGSHRFNPVNAVSSIQLSDLINGNALADIFVFGRIAAENAAASK